MKKLISVFLMFMVLISCTFISSADERQTSLTLPQTMTLSETNLSITKKAPKTTLVATIYPETARQEVKWETSDSKIATVDSKGKITAKKVGSCRITATSLYNDTVTQSCYLTVVEPTTPIEEFNSNKEDYTVVVGKKVKLQYEIKPSSASNKYISFTVEDKDICNVDSSGYVYGNESGDTVVTAKTDDGGFELEFYVTVSESNDANYDSFKDDYPDLNVISTTNVDEGIWMEVESIGTLFYDNYIGEFRKGGQIIGGHQYLFEEQTKSILKEEEDEEEEEPQYTSYMFPIMKTGWHKTNLDWTFYKGDGKLANNEWIRDNNNWYLLDTDGIMIHSGEKWIGSNKYLFASSGEAVVGFRVVEGSIKHYNQDDCSMDINRWFKEPDGRWYYADEKGDIVKSTYINSTTDNCDYYVDDKGVMLFNVVTPDGRVADEQGRIGYTGVVTESKENKDEVKGPGVKFTSPKSSS